MKAWPTNHSFNRTIPLRLSGLPTRPHLPSSSQFRHFSMSSSVQERAAQEKAVGRNPHPDFKTVESQRQEWQSTPWSWSQTHSPNWKPGDGGNDGGASLQKNHREIDPYAEGRQPAANYKLLISAITPRFIGFLSTRSKDGKSTNLAPFSYTTVVNHDPPIFCVGFAGSMDKAKDSLKNLTETGECVINVISEHFIEAANYCSINAPDGISEFALSGLHPAPSSTVKASRVKESVFSVEGKLIDTKEWESKSVPGKKTGVLAIIEGTRFWAREDAINEEGSLLDPAIVKPVSRLGGITYGRTVDGFELPRPDFESERSKGALDGLEKPLAEGQ